MATSILGKRKFEEEACAHLLTLTVNETVEENACKRRRLSHLTSKNGFNTDDSDDDDSSIDLDSGDELTDFDVEQKSESSTVTPSPSKRKNKSKTKKKSPKQKTKIQTRLVLQNKYGGILSKNKKQTIECSVCGMLYIKNERQDNEIHSKYHTSIVKLLNISLKMFDLHLKSFIIWDYNNICNRIQVYHKTKLLSIENKYNNKKKEKSSSSDKPGNVNVNTTHTKETDKEKEKKEKETGSKGKDSDKKVVYGIFERCKKQNDPFSISKMKLDKKFSKKLNESQNDCIVRFNYDEFYQVMDENCDIFYACKIMDRELGYFNSQMEKSERNNNNNGNSNSNSNSNNSSNDNNENRNFCLEKGQFLYLYIRQFNKNDKNKNKNQNKNKAKTGSNSKNVQNGKKQNVNDVKYNIIGGIVCESKNVAYLIKDRKKELKKDNNKNKNKNKCENSNGNDSVDSFFDNDCVQRDNVKRKCKVGIVKIWVNKAYRRQGIASFMVDCVRNTWQNLILNEKEQNNCNNKKDSKIKKKYIGFCQPTRFGRTFAQKYVGNSKFLVY